ncbi:MAG TPA: P1 family peptidase [Blastocatellia bacterium]|nr:P1 family peptidase [Blastocatellia bacterium]
MSETEAGSLTSVSGIRVGHAQDTSAKTGVTVVLCGNEGAVAAVDVRGAAPGTRETDLLDPSNLVERVHAVVLTGGSVFGLDAACGVVRYLEENGIGFDTGIARVPIVPAAVIYDMGVGDPRVRPNAEMGYAACQQSSSGPVATGLVGAGTGATVGKILGHGFSSPGGVGTASQKIRGGATVGVLVVVNAFGDIVDPGTGEIVSGAKLPDGTGWVDTNTEISRSEAPDLPSSSRLQNTTLAVVATDAALTPGQARRVAMMAHDGLARAIRPVHTMFDGDTVFALSTGAVVADVTVIGSVAADLLVRAIVGVGRAQQR